MHVYNGSDLGLGVIFLVGGLYFFGSAVSARVRPGKTRGLSQLDSWRDALLGLFWVFAGLHNGALACLSPIHPSSRLVALSLGSEIAWIVVFVVWAVLFGKALIDRRRAKAAAREAPGPQ